MKTTLTTAFLVPLLTLSACSVRQFPPPATPPPVLSQAMPPAPPPVPGAGQVALEVQDGPAEASEVVGSYQIVNISRHGTSVTPGEISNTLCTTPCVANLANGRHNLRFRSLIDPERTSTATLIVSPQPTGYRHALGIERPHTGARLGGLLLTISGALLLPIGILGASTNTSTTSGVDNTGFGPGSITLTVSGVVSLAAGIALLLAFPPEYQRGSGVQFTLPSAVGAQTSP